MLILLLALLAQSKNPEYDHWAGFKPGSWVKIKGEAEQGGAKIAVETTHTLMELTKEKAVIERKAKVPGQAERIEKEEIVASDPNPITIEKEGDEEVEVAGKKVKCHWIQGSQKTTKVKYWISKDVPGGVVKGEMTVPGGPGVMTFAATAWEKK